MLPRKRSLPVTSKATLTNTFSKHHNKIKTDTENNKNKTTNKILCNNDDKFTETATSITTSTTRGGKVMLYFNKYKLKLSKYERKKRCMIIISLSAISLLLILYIKAILFGYYSIRGGLIGLGIDSFFKSKLNYYTSQALYDKYDLLGSSSNNGNDNYNDPRMYYERYYELEIASLQSINLLCRFKHNNNNNDENTKNKNNIHNTIVPMYLLQAPNDIFEAGSNIIERNAYNKGFKSILFSDVHVRSILRDIVTIVSSSSSIHNNKNSQISSILSLYSSSKVSISSKQFLFGIASVYTFGGLFLSDSLLEHTITMKKEENIYNETLLIEEYLSTHLKKNSLDSSSSCYSDFLIILNSQQHKNTDEDHDLSLLLASPRHPALLSTLNELLSKDSHELIHSTYNNYTYLQSMLAHSIASYNNNKNKKHQQSSVQMFQHSCINDQCKVQYPLISSSSQKTLLSYTKKQAAKNKKEQSNNNLYPMIKIYQETPFKPPNLQYLKKSLHLKMIVDRCEPSWLCNRCLKYAGLGTYSKCSNVCKSCFIDLMCNPKSIKPRIYQPIDLYINHTSMMFSLNYNINNNNGKSINYIPKIIFQTWFEGLNIDSYPNLIRLQNSWRASGWEYRFYDDANARNFILEYYPSVFVEAYDALIPGAFKADFFRYLVLLVHGGIYADIDLMLNTNLETLITPNLSFITARDTVGLENNSPFCLWNGFIGSSPGHPFLIEVIQRSLNFIRNRANIIDLEQDICTKVGNLDLMESWKVKSEQGLVLTGPCALGISVNTVLEQYPLQKFPLGFLPINNYQLKNNIIKGDTHILSLKKKDLGSLRLSDIERNVIVATTNIPHMSKFPSVEVTSPKTNNLYPNDSESSQFVRKGNNRLHYSSTSGGNWDWGTRGVYTDSLVVDDYVKIVVKNVV